MKSFIRNIWLGIAIMLTMGFSVLTSPQAAPFAYIANRGDDTISIIDTATKTVMEIVAVGDEPIGVAVHPSGASVYVINTEDDTMSIIDTTTNSVIDTIGVGYAAWGVAVHPSGHRAYVTNISSPGNVTVVDTINKAVVTNIPVGSGARAIEVSPLGTKAYVTNTVDGTVSVIDTNTNTVTDTITVGNDPRMLAIHPSGATLYVAHYDGPLTVIDTASSSVTQTVNDAGLGVAVHPSGSEIYANGEYAMVVIDSTTLTITETIPLGHYSSGLAVSPNGSSVYAPDRYNNSVSVVDIHTRDVTVVAVGSTPDVFGHFIGGSFCEEDDSGALDIVGKYGIPSSSVTIPIRIQNAPNAVNSLGFEVAFPSVLTYIGFERGMLVEQFEFFDCSVSEPGIVRCGGLTVVDEIAAGSNGEVVLLQFSVDSDYNSPEELTLQGLKDDIAGWSASHGCLEPRCSCDVNGDGEVTPGDALCAFQCYLGITATDCGDCEDICCDVNQDGEVTPADALEVFKAYLGIESVCSSQK